MRIVITTALSTLFLASPALALGPDPFDPFKTGDSCGPRSCDYNLPAPAQREDVAPRHEHSLKDVYGSTLSACQSDWRACDGHDFWAGQQRNGN